MQRSLQDELVASSDAEIENLVGQLDIDSKANANEFAEMRGEILKWAKNLNVTTLAEIRAIAQKASIHISCIILF